LSISVATDVGGTFTDLVGYDRRTGEIIVAKDSTTPDDFSLGILSALAKSGLPPRSVKKYFANGSTVVINALTERNGVRTALFTTRGFRDVLEIQRSNRPDIYNFTYTKPTAFIPRELCFEVRERLDAEGRVIEELDLTELTTHLRRCREKNVQAIAICLLNAYRNGVHERTCAEWIRKHVPEILVCCSHELTQEYREYERANTTALNSYVQPVVAQYLANLQSSLRKVGVSGQLYAMASNGGVMSFSQAERAPIQVVESGPVAGAIGARSIGEMIGESNLLTLDVGGTTAKTTLIYKGQLRINSDYFIEKNPTSAGYPLKVACLDIVEIGAGGGSIFNQDETGALRVGPLSAGAVPGPASYGRGGTRPTVTDAFLLTGVLNGDYFLGGDIRLSKERAYEAFASESRKLGIPVAELAQGTVRLANSQIINALKLVSVKRGYDPRDFTLVAYGGGGPLHASNVARQLGIPKVLIPPLPGVFSAWGMLMADLRRDFLRTQIMLVDRHCPGKLQSTFGELERQAREAFFQEGHEEQIRMERYVDARYLGQEHSVKVPVPQAALKNQDMKALRRSFDELHRRAYEFTLKDAMEIVTCHLVAYVKLPKPVIRPIPPRKGSRTKPKESRFIHLEDKAARVEVFERSNLAPGMQLKGPAVIEEPTSTTIVNREDRLRVDQYGNLQIEIRDRSQG
jgi:N-methylhydantoinase A